MYDAEEVINGKNYINTDINIPGKIQKENSQLAIFTLNFLRDFNISQLAIAKGLKTVQWHGRNQIIQKQPLIIFDVAHNAAGIHSFITYYITSHWISLILKIFKVCNIKIIRITKKNNYNFSAK